MTNVGCTSVGSTTFENRSSTSSGQVRPSVGMSEPEAAIAAASASRSRSSSTSMPVASWIASRSVTRR